MSLDGIDCGGLVETGEWVTITENFTGAVYLGALSLHPAEREVLVPEGTTYTVFKKYFTLQDFLNDFPNIGLNQEVMKFFSSRFTQTAYRNRKFIIIGGLQGAIDLEDLLNKNNLR